MLFVGESPVPEEPVLAMRFGPAVLEAQQSVRHVLLGILQVELHVGVEAFQHPPVAVLQVGLPGSVDDKGAPEWTASAGPRCRCHVRHLAVVALRIAVCLKPVAIEGIEVVHGLCCQNGGVAVTAVAHTLMVGTIHHVSALRQTFEGVVHHVVDGIDVCIVADEGRLAFIARIDAEAFDVGKGRLVAKPLNLHVAEGMVGELVAECLVPCSIGYVAVSIDSIVEVAVQCQHVAVADADLLSCVKPSQVDAYPSDNAAAHIYHPCVVAIAGNLLWLDDLLNLVGFTHHGCDFSVRCILHQGGGLPFGSLQRGVGEVWQDFFCLD